VERTALRRRLTWQSATVVSTSFVRTGDQLEFRGPIGGQFVWTDELGGPLFLMGGGSGLVTADLS
jgi:NAD(P)H-flavin reductase